MTDSLRPKQQWTPDRILERLRHDRPLFHQVGVGSPHLAKLGISVPAGLYTFGVDPLALEWIARQLNEEMITLETGAGNTTVIFAALAKEHYCFTAASGEQERITAYLKSLQISPERVHFVIGQSDATLPRWNMGQIVDFAYIDGAHGYPLPALDWHYIDKALKIGGTVGMDNSELRPVREHCEFLEENGTYDLLHKFYGGTFSSFYQKKLNEFREWTEQAYSRKKRDPCDWKLKTRVRRHLSRWIKPYLL